MMQTLLNLKSALSFNWISEEQPEDRLARIPWWVWSVLVGLVIIVAIIVTLRDEEEEDMDLELPEARVIPLGPEPIAQSFVPSVSIIEPAELAPAAPSESIVSSLPRHPDNLKRIKGVGPKIEKLLNENGITTFAQLAAMKPSEIQVLLDLVDWTDFADPTTWPEQARELAAATGNNKS